MKKDVRLLYIIAVSLLLSFVGWTIALVLVDVQAIGAQETKLGFATVNQFVHNAIGVRMWLYELTDWLSIIPLFCVLMLAGIGVIQWIKRKQLLKVDRDLLVLGIFYVTVILLFFIFEILEINYRPILIQGKLEASYPSSTTLLVSCVMPTTAIQCNARIKNKIWRGILGLIVGIFTCFMIIARFLSGVHWMTDIIGGILLGGGIITLYWAIYKQMKKN